MKTSIPKSLAVLFAGFAASALTAGELTDRFVAEAREAYATAAYADYRTSVLSATAYRDAAKAVPRADLGAGTVRWIDVGGTCNFRDLGGWTGLKTGLVYRGAEPNCHTNAETLARLKYRCHGLFLTEAGRKTLSRDLRIRTDLDLRSSGESPTPDVTPVPGAKLVRIPCSSYTNFLRETKIAARLLRVFAKEENYPVYFHCYGGADRTGSLAFLLEGLCGVGEADLAIDYELTSFSRIGLRPRYDGSYHFASMVREMKRRPGATLGEKIESYVTGECGLTADEVAAIRRILTPANPEGKAKPAAKLKPKVLMVMFDGGRADCYYNAKCPTLHRLVGGAWAEGYRCARSFSGRTILDARTYSYPNHSAILSGITAAKHGIRFNFEVKGFDSAKFPNWIACLHRAKPALDCRYFYADGCDASIGNDRSLPMFVPSGKPEVCDARTEAEAVKAFSQAEVPDAATFFLEEPDCSGHASTYYPSDAKYLNAFSRSDAHLGKVLDAIKSRPQFAGEDWLILFTTDHGGVGSNHGTMGGHCETVPVFVVGRHVGHGTLAGRPRLVDLPATALAHFGLRAKDFGMDGKPLGDRVIPDAPAPLAEGLVAYMPFSCRNNVGENVIKSGGVVASGWGDLEYLKNSYSDKEGFPSGAPTPLFGRIYGTEGVPVAYRLDGAGRVFADRRRGFTLSFWMRQWNDHSDGRQNPVVLGNRDLSDPKSTGFAIRMADFAPRVPHGVGLEFTDAEGNARCLGVYAQEVRHWNFYALSVRPDGVVLFYQGRIYGDFHLIADSTRGADFGSRLPFYLGQDGTGAHRFGDWFDVDEFGLWNRVLSPDELREVYNRGRQRRPLVDGIKLY